MRFFTSILLSTLLLLSTSALAAPRKPNILFILLDDMGYGDLTCSDPQAAPTPRIDQLAKEGIRFTQFYVKDRKREDRKRDRSN